jgi:eukaryotic-like serine/threonine-protein kinase
MPKELPCCDQTHIEDLLDGRLSLEEQSRLENHLENCPTCRSRIETSAAEHAYWREASAHLRDDELDDELRTSVWTGSAGLEELAKDASVRALRIADYFDPTDDPRMLGRFGGYEVVGIIGYGGMGVVLKGFEAALDRYVAIKLLAPHLASSGAARARFRREARAAAAVLHENVVAIHSVSEAKELPFLVMPYMNGDSLQKRLDQQGPMQTREILRIGMQIAAGLAAAHAQGLVHRDIKPGNILLDKGVERVTITDFGLARAADDASLTHSGVIAGTPQYMSPEQARGEPLDCRSDLFSLGSVLYTMCTGRPPFRAQTAFGVLHRISESAPTTIRELAPETPEWLCEIVAKLHAKDPKNRLQSAVEVADLLGRWLAHIQQPTVIPAPPRLVSERLRTRRVRRRTIAATLGILAVVLTIAVFVWRPWNTKTGDQTAESHIGRAESAEMASQDALSLAIVLDERTLQEDCRSVRERILTIEQDWRQSPSPIDETHWQAELLKLHRQADDLGQRIDRNLP